MQPIDITGQTFGRLTAIRAVGVGDRGGRKWLFTCVCGNELVTRLSASRSGKTKSCGCLQREVARENVKSSRESKARNSPDLFERFWSKVEVRAKQECWPWRAGLRRNDEGYGAFWLNGRHQPASRVAWILTNGDVPIDLVVCHRCDNPRCCNPNHLFLDTSKGNNDDKVSKRRHCFGERQARSLLTEQLVNEIRKLKPAGKAPYGFRKSIAQQFGVKACTINDVWRGRSWKHI